MLVNHINYNHNGESTSRTIKEGHTKGWKTGLNEDISSASFSIMQRMGLCDKEPLSYSIGCTTLISGAACGSSHCHRRNYTG